MQSTRATRVARVEPRLAQERGNTTQIDDFHSRPTGAALRDESSAPQNRSMLEGQRPNSGEGTPVVCQQHTATEAHADDHESLQAHGQLVTRRVEELRPHPSFARHHLNVPLAALSVAASQADLGLREPITITQDNVILKGYAQWKLAGLQGRETLLCIEYTLSEEEALRRLLQSHHRSHVLNDFARIVLALDLEPWLQEKARSNQRSGGQSKGSSTLAKASRVDVRSQIAAAASVSTGNVTKVKQVLQLAHADVLEALRLGDVSIHRAWLWSKRDAREQTQRLFEHQGEKGVRRTIRQLISRYQPEAPRPVLALPELLRGLQEINRRERSCNIEVAVVDTHGFGILVTKELFQAIESQKELPL